MIRRFQNPHAQRGREEPITRAQLLQEDLGYVDPVSQDATWATVEAVASLHDLEGISFPPPRKRQKTYIVDSLASAESLAIRSSQYRGNLCNVY
jgi:hypothetical protein